MRCSANLVKRWLHHADNRFRGEFLHVMRVCETCQGVIFCTSSLAEETHPFSLVYAVAIELAAPVPGQSVSDVLDRRKVLVVGPDSLN